MKTQFITHNSTNTRLLIIFAGWSTYPSLYSDLKAEGWDILLAYDYRDFEIDTTLLDDYSTIYVMAWSLGVYAAAASLMPDRITAAIAINGTLDPINDSMGIPRDIYLGTASSLNQRNLMKFRKRMSGTSDNYARLVPDNADDIEQLRSELYFISEHYNSNRHLSNLPWMFALAATEDYIFPHHNMMKSWHEKGIICHSYEGPHFPDLNRCLRLMIPDRGTMARNFYNARSTYDSEASAQLMAAKHLGGMIATRDVRKHGKLLEIGVGTGLFSKIYTPLLEPSEAVLMDINPIPEIQVAQSQRFICGDAEELLPVDEKFDYILSTSTVQWFSNLPLFISRVAEMLKPGGLLAISTFAPGNLSELDAIRPTPLRYYSSVEIADMLPSSLTEPITEDDEIILQFESVRELLLHLRHTGVAGSTPSSNKGAVLPPLTTLTYRPLYLTAIKKISNNVLP